MCSLSLSLSIVEDMLKVCDSSRKNEDFKLMYGARLCGVMSIDAVKWLRLRNLLRMAVL